jgi:SAM-dependent methyltransferase
VSTIDRRQWLSGAEANSPQKRGAARCTGVTAQLGDARELPYEDDSHDAVLLLGPLYHLPDRADRIRALAEARRVARSGGLVAAASISRYAALHDHWRTGGFAEPGVHDRMLRILTTGALHHTSLFTTAYFHEPAELLAEFAEAGLADPVRHGLEGAAWLVGDMEGHLDDPGRRAMVLEALMATSSEPSLLGVSGHLLTVARA